MTGKRNFKNPRLTYGCGIIAAELVKSAGNPEISKALASRFA